MSPLRIRFVFLCLPLLLVGCVGARLPSSPSALVPSYVLAPASHGTLDRYADRIDAELAQDESAYWLLDRNDMALTARLALTDHAISTLDIQYFMWETDETARLLMRRVIQAADRGVRVRVLLDDFAVDGLDAEVAGLNYHPLIEVRVFNPWKYRGPKLLKAVEFFRRAGLLNHRMHNKIYVADNRFAIIGGRNIGNRYFGLHEDFVQNDLDVMMAGPLVSDVSASFDLFWNSHLVYPAKDFAGNADPVLLFNELIARIDADVTAGAALLQSFPLQPIHWDGYLEELTRSFKSGLGELYYDSPLVEHERPDQMYPHLLNLMSKAEREVLISSPYFIPDREFIEHLRGLTEKGIRVVILTNSLASNNHAIAHTGYKRWRKPVLRAGAELYELRSDAEVKSLYSTPPAEVRALGLHIKALVVDRNEVFIGSPNIDPRSLFLNTEMGIVAEGDLAQQVADLILRDISPDNAWEVTLAQGRGLVWKSSQGTLKRQPADTLKERSVAFFLGFLPLKKQL